LRFYLSDLLKKIERDALSLSQPERAFLVDRLLSSLDGDTLNDIDVAWIAEAERRYQEYKDGERKGIPANEVSG
jgi:putative addiction module component (TIGR02574 family)